MDQERSDRTLACTTAEIHPLMPSSCPRLFQSLLCSLPNPPVTLLPPLFLLYGGQGEPLPHAWRLWLFALQLQCPFCKDALGLTVVDNKSCYQKLKMGLGCKFHFTATLVLMHSRRGGYRKAQERENQREDRNTFTVC